MEPCEAGQGTDWQKGLDSAGQPLLPFCRPSCDSDRIRKLVTWPSRSEDSCSRGDHRRHKLVVAAGYTQAERKELQHP
jgi:hypothetical protein